MAASHMAPKSEGGKPTVSGWLSALLPSIIISAVLPLVLYMLVSPYLPTLAALAVTAIPPLLYSGYAWARTRSIDPISATALVTLAASMLLALLVHDPRLLMLRDSYLTGAFGLLCLLSLLSRRPVAYYVYRWMFVHTPEQQARLDAGWQVPYARFVRRLATAVWGLAFVGETLLDTYLIYHLPINEWVVIHPFLFWGTIVAAFGWATIYARRVQPKIDASLRAYDPPQSP